MKKLTVMALIMTMAIGLCACGGNTETPVETEPTVEEQTVEEPAAEEQEAEEPAEAEEETEEAGEAEETEEAAEETASADEFVSEDGRLTFTIGQYDETKIKEIEPKADGYWVNVNMATLPSEGIKNAKIYVRGVIDVNNQIDHLIENWVSTNETAKEIDKLTYNGIEYRVVDTYRENGSVELRRLACELEDGTVAAFMINMPDTETSFFSSQEDLDFILEEAMSRYTFK